MLLHVGHRGLQWSQLIGELRIVTRLKRTTFSIACLYTALIKAWSLTLQGWGRQRHHQISKKDSDKSSLLRFLLRSAEGSQSEMETRHRSLVLEKTPSHGRKGPLRAFTWIPPPPGVWARQRPVSPSRQRTTHWVSGSKRQVGSKGNPCESYLPRTPTPTGQDGCSGGSILSFLPLEGGFASAPAPRKSSRCCGLPTAP